MICSIILKIYFWNVGLCFHSRPTLSRISNRVTRYQDTPVDKEGSILQLAPTGGHSEIPVGNHQRGSPSRGSPMIESSSLESHTKMSKSETGRSIRGDR